MGADNETKEDVKDVAAEAAAAAAAATVAEDNGEFAGMIYEYLL